MSSYITLNIVFKTVKLNKKIICNDPTDFIPLLSNPIPPPLPLPSLLSPSPPPPSSRSTYPFLTHSPLFSPSSLPSPTLTLLNHPLPILPPPFLIISPSPPPLPMPPPLSPSLLHASSPLPLPSSCLLPSPLPKKPESNARGNEVPTCPSLHKTRLSLNGKNYRHPIKSNKSLSRSLSKGRRC